VSQEKKSFAHQFSIGCSKPSPPGKINPLGYLLRKWIWEDIKEGWKNNWVEIKIKLYSYINVMVENKRKLPEFIRDKIN
jgi:hypothetical protein